jgi:hypothetical protein
MRLSNDYEDFMLKLDRIHPPYGKTMPLALQEGNAALTTDEAAN